MFPIFQNVVYPKYENNYLSYFLKVALHWKSPNEAFEFNTFLSKIFAHIYSPTYKKRMCKIGKLVSLGVHKPVTGTT